VKYSLVGVLFHQNTLYVYTTISMLCFNRRGAVSCGLYYKPIMIVNDDSRIVTKFETSLTDDARVIIYDRHMFIVQATDQCAVHARQGVNQRDCCMHIDR
jgi:hypothetical protein